MGTISIKAEERIVTEKGKRVRYDCVYDKAELKKFSPAVLGLGDVGQKSRRTDVIAGVFDLSGFTDFCSQADAHLTMPRFLREFLGWLFKNIEGAFIEKTFGEGVVLYSDLPFFAKFTGDGVLFLWNTGNMDMRKICNVLIIAGNICLRYRRDFVPIANKYASGAPGALRCGLACGLVSSVGNGEDYVGSCINTASRLQKLSNLELSCSQKGISIEEGMPGSTAKDYMTKRVRLRGIGKGELVIVRKWDFERLSTAEQRIFKDV